MNGAFRYLRGLGIFGRNVASSCDARVLAVTVPVPHVGCFRKSQHGTSQKAVEKEISGRDDFVTVFFGGFYENFMDTHGISAYLGGYVVRKKMRETIFFTG
jgi:hypothetical protein